MLKKVIAIVVIIAINVVFFAFVLSTHDEKRDITFVDSMAIKIIDAVNRGDAKAISDLETDHFREKAGGKEVARRLGELGREYGRIGSLTKYLSIGPTHLFRIIGQNGEGVMILRISEDQRLDAFYFRNAPRRDPVPNKNGIPLRLPFRGDWTIISGGSDPRNNTHIGPMLTNETYATDFERTDETGGNRSGNLTRLDAYYSYGQDILAAAEGVVATVIDGVPDNEIGFPNGSCATGNAVVIRHGEGEYTGYFHLNPYSIAVKKGDHVDAGTVLGQCGNSGLSITPHLHFQTMTEASLPTARGFPHEFAKVLVTHPGKTGAEPATDYQPLPKDRVRNP